MTTRLTSVPVRAFQRANLVLNLGVSGSIIGMVLSAVLDVSGRAERESSAAAVIAGSIGLGVVRGLVMGVWTDPDGIRVRNPWTTRRVRWSDVERVVAYHVLPPQPGSGGTVPGLVIRGRERVLPLYPLLNIGPWTGRLGRYNHFLRDTVRAWQQQFGVTVWAWSREPPGGKEPPAHLRRR